MNSAVHTQNTERLCRDIKERVRRPGVRSKYLYQCLAQYLFSSSMKAGIPLHPFFVQAGKLYLPLSDAARHRGQCEAVESESSEEEEEEVRPKEI